MGNDWSAAVKSPRLLRIALEMLLRGWLEETESYRQRHQAELSRDGDYYMLLYNLGQQYSQRQDHKRALPLYEEAIRRRPEFGAAHNIGDVFKDLDLTTLPRDLLPDDHNQALRVSISVSMSQSLL